MMFLQGFWHTLTGLGFKPLFIGFSKLANYDAGASLARWIKGEKV